MNGVRVYIQEHGLQQVLSKMKIVMLIRWKIPIVALMTVGSDVVQTKRAAKY